MYAPLQKSEGPYQCFPLVHLSLCIDTMHSNYNAWLQDYGCIKSLDWSGDRTGGLCFFVVIVVVVFKAISVPNTIPICFAVGHLT